MNADTQHNEVTTEIVKVPREALVRGSQAMDTILSTRPGFMVRWGNVIFAITFALILLGCWLIHYPDIVKGTAKLTCINAPKPVVAINGGKLIELRAQENQFIKKGEVLGLIESTAIHEDVFRVNASLDSIQLLLNSGQAESIEKYFRTTPIMGEMQGPYQVYLQAYLHYRNYLPNGLHRKRRQMLFQDQANLAQLKVYLNEQLDLHQQELDNTKKTFEANQSLWESKVISDFDLRTEQGKVISKKLTIPQVKSSIASIVNQEAEKSKEIMALTNEIEQQDALFIQATNTLRSQIDDWKRRYALIAPIDGQIAFSAFIEQDQQLQVNQTICFITPRQSRYFAEVSIPQTNFGKIQVRNKVLVKFRSYPYEEFGLVVGVIQFVSQIPSEDGYRAKVTFPNGLKTTHNYQIVYRDGLLADAEIVTKDMNLLQRFYYDLVSAIK
jgi:multidrug efflux pump subunit AcrA (membrane-fusion protein)